MWGLGEQKCHGNLKMSYYYNIQQGKTNFSPLLEKLPKTTWRTVEKERSRERWHSWAAVRAAAADQDVWDASVMALCNYWREEL